MSTTASIANFAVDADGKEVPIRYKAEDLVNKCAPEGYIWQRRTPYDDDKDRFIEGYDAWLEKSQANWDKEQARVASRTPDEIEIESRMGLYNFDFDRYLAYGDDRPEHDFERHWRIRWTNSKDKHLFDQYYVAKRMKDE